MNSTAASTRTTHSRFTYSALIALLASLLLAACDDHRRPVEPSSPVATVAVRGVALTPDPRGVLVRNQTRPQTLLAKLASFFIGASHAQVAGLAPLSNANVFVFRVVQQPTTRPADPAVHYFGELTVGELLATATTDANGEFEVQVDPALVPALDAWIQVTHSASPLQPGTAGALSFPLASDSLRLDVFSEVLGRWLTQLENQLHDFNETPAVDLSGLSAPRVMSYLDLMRSSMASSLPFMPADAELAVEQININLARQNPSFAGASCSDVIQGYLRGEAGHPFLWVWTDGHTFRTQVANPINRQLPIPDPCSTGVPDELDIDHYAGFEIAPYTLALRGAPAPVSYSLEGAPQWLSMDESGVLHGVPANPVRTEEFLVHARDAESQEIGATRVRINVLSNGGRLSALWPDIVVARQPVTADASPSLGPYNTPNEGISGYEWCFGAAPNSPWGPCDESNPAFYPARGPSQARVTHTFPSPGTYRYRLRVHLQYPHPADGVRVTGGRDLDGTVTVHQASGPSPAFTISPEHPQPGETVTFDASGSIHRSVGRSIVQYAWDFNSDDVIDETHGPGDTTAQRAFPADLHEITLYVTDDDPVPITRGVRRQLFISAFAGPTAAFTVNPSTATVGQTITFDASASFDPKPNGGIIGYSWDLDGDGNFETGGGAGARVVQHTYAARGSYFPRLRVFNSDTPPRTDEVTRVVSIDGTFLTVALTSTGSGTVTSEIVGPNGYEPHPGIQCGTDCAESYDLGATVKLIATPGAGSRFMSFGAVDPVASCDETNLAARECILVMNGSKHVDVEFVRVIGGVPLTVSKTGTGSGVVTSEIVGPNGPEPHPGIQCGTDCAEDYDSGTAVKLIATPDPGSHFVSFGAFDPVMSCDDTNGAARECFLFMNRPKHVTVEFAQ
ncbi:MAG TPA: PKD domain-containing protein [Steroidobacteraceae bacterium]|nr:PKD domain-containing protein [Steroidobacteraceae bacterium]